MHIVWLAHRDPWAQRSGGAERTIREVCSRLAASGHEIKIFSVGVRKTLAPSKGIQIQYSSSPFAVHARWARFLLRGRGLPDVVVHDLAHVVPWYRPLRRRRNTPKVIAFFRHLHARTLPLQVDPLSRQILTRIERGYRTIYHDSLFVTESHSSINDLVQLGIRRDRIVRIPPGVDRNTFRPTQPSADPLIIYFGGLRAYKRPEQGLFLLKNIRDRNLPARLNVAGSGPESERLKKLAERLGVQTQVRFLGYLPDQELSLAVGQAWMNIHCAIAEGWGLTITEAAAAAVPTLAYAVPGVTDSIRPGFNGLVVPEGDRSSLANSAYRILNDPKPWRESSLRWAKRFSWDLCVRSWERLLQDDLEGAEEYARQIDAN